MRDIPIRKCGGGYLGQICVRRDRRVLLGVRQREHQVHKGAVMAEGKWAGKRWYEIVNKIFTAGVVVRSHHGIEQHSMPERGAMVR